MKIFNKKYSFLMVTILLIAIGCRKEYVQELKPFEGSFFLTAPYINTDSSYTDSVTGKRINRIFLNLNAQASFADLSQGVKARKWFIEEGSGDIVGSTNDTTSTEQKISVKYGKAGFFKVRLLTNFKSDSLGSFITKNVVRPSTGAVDSLVYIIVKHPSTQDTTIYVQVLDSLKANFATVSGQTTFEAQQPISFKSISKGLPVGYTWSFVGSTTPISAIANPTGIIYKKSGTYQVALTVTRPNLLYNNAKGGRDSVIKSGFITIIPSKQPLQFRNGSVGDDNKSIQLSFNQDISVLPAGSEFTVKADGINVQVVSVIYTNPGTDESVIALKFAQAFPIGSEITVTSTTNIKAEGKNLVTAINKKFLAPLGNIFPALYGSMEGTSALLPQLFLPGSAAFAASSNANAYWGIGGPGINKSASSTDSFQGNYSMLFTSTTIFGYIQNRLSPYFQLTKGKTYRFVVYAKLAPTSASGAKLNVSVWNNASVTNIGNVNDTGGVILDNTWIRIAKDLTITSNSGDYFLRFGNFTANGQYLIDEISVYEIP